MIVKECAAGLANYRIFINRLDQLCEKIVHDFAAEITCKAGCSGCCRHLTLFPVEAANLANALAGLDAEVLLLLSQRHDWTESACPLLLNDCCLVYSDRPVICRTHGLPLLAEVGGARQVDFCPENFRGITALPGEAVINLESVNSALVAVNEQFAATALPGWLPARRLSIAEIITIVTKSGEMPDDTA